MSELPAGTAGAATVLITGTSGETGYAMAWSRPRRRSAEPPQPAVAGHRDGTVHAGLPPHGVQNLRPGGDKSSTGIRVWMGFDPRA
jgi:hypothetical protein